MKPNVAILILLLGMLSPALASRRTPVVEAVEKVLPAVVNIGTEKQVMVSYTDPWRKMRGSMLDQFYMDFFGPPRAPAYRTAQSLGSGVIVDREGYILTNYHVVQRAARIRVTMADGTQRDAQLIAGDETNDLALLKLDGDVDLPEMVLAADDDLLLGETVVVLGNPYGLGHSVTVGVLSAKNREAAFEGQVLYHDILQTDAAVNPGSSGGPMVNLDGQVIGINVAVHREAQNIGFGIPAKRVRQLLQKWFDPARMEKIWLGFSAEQTLEGLVVQAVEEKSPAAISGLGVGDRLISVNGEKVNTILDAYKRMLGTAPGDPVDLEVLRGGGVEWIRLEAGEFPWMAHSEKLQDRLGVRFRKNPDQNTAGFAGLMIDTVEPGTPAARAGLKPGLFVQRVNGMDVKSSEDVALAVAQNPDRDWVDLDVVELEERSTMVLARSSHLRLEI